jgi:hypothetical protein
MEERKRNMLKLKFERLAVPNVYDRCTAARTVLNNSVIKKDKVLSRLIVKAPYGSWAFDYKDYPIIANRLKDKNVELELL